MDAALTIPADWDDLTPEWMTAALAGRNPGVVVDGVTLTMRDDGNNRRARFDLTYAAGDGPATVFAKAEGAHRDVHARNGNLFNEPDLFESRAPLPLDHPQPFGVVIDRPNLDYLIVMEDLTLRGADPRDATRPMTPDQVAAGLRGLARLHSRYLGFDAATHPELAWVQTWAPTEGFASGLRQWVPTGIERSGAAIPASVAAMGEDGVVGRWSRYVASLSREPMTLLHADAHIGNTYVLPGDDVGFLDWQVLRRGGWSQDVGYFLVGALTVADRRAHEEDLLRAYLAELPAAHRPSWDDAWLRHRAAVAYGLAIWLSTLGTDGYQRREVSLALTERYARAFVDLDTDAALARLP